MPASNPKGNATLAHVDNVDDFPGASGTPASTNLTQLKGSAIASGAGAADAATLRTNTASDSPDVTALAAANVLLTAANALQTAANALLTTIDADTGTIAGDTTSIDAKTPALGAAAMVASSPVTLATNDTHMGAVGAASDVDGVVHGQLRYTGEATEASRALLATINADTGTIAGDTTSIDGKIPALGSAAAAASSPTTIATDDPHFGAVGAASDVDGVLHGQLRYAGEAAEASRALLATIDADTGAISSVEGTTADAGVTTDAAGTISAKLRGWIVLLLSYLAQVGQAVKSYGLSIVVSDGTNARLLLGDTSGQAKTRPPSPGDAETITAILGADPVTAEMVAIDLDTVYVTVQGSVVANAGTNNRIVLYGEPRDTGAIAAIPAADFTVMETNGPFRVGIKPEPVGMLYKKIGARKYFTDGGADPVFTIYMRQRK